MAIQQFLSSNGYQIKDGEVIDLNTNVASLLDIKPGEEIITEDLNILIKVKEAKKKEKEEEEEEEEDNNNNNSDECDPPPISNRPN